MLNQAKQEFNQTKQEFNQEKISHIQTREELNQYKKELKQAKIELDHEKSEKKLCTQSIIVGGNNKFNQLWAKSNNKNRGDKPAIHPPLLLSELSDQEIVCASGKNDHSLAVSKEGHVFGCGSNKNGRLGLGKETESVSSFTEISSLKG